MRYLWLVFAIVLALIGLAAARLLKLSEPAAYAVMWVPMFLALFPFMKRWMPEARFVYWALAAAISSAVGWLLYLALR